MSAVTMLMWKGPSIGWADWLFMLRWENEKDLSIIRGGGRSIVHFYCSKYILKK